MMLRRLTVQIRKIVTKNIDEQFGRDVEKGDPAQLKLLFD